MRERVLGIIIGIRSVEGGFFRAKNVFENLVGFYGPFTFIYLRFCPLTLVLSIVLLEY